MRSPRMIRKFALVALVAAASLSTHSGLRAGGPPTGSPKVVPPTAKFRGLSYGEWSARWWQWAFSLPTDHHPLFDTAPASAGQTGKVWFLGASFVSTTDPATGETTAIATREAKIPSDTALFIAVLNSEASTLEGNGDTFVELAVAAAGFQDFAENLAIEIDGEPVRDLDAFRVQSPSFVYGPLPESNVLQSLGLDAPAGSTSLAAADGVYVMLHPMKTGRHTVRFRGELPAYLFSVDITYHLTVGP